MTLTREFMIQYMRDKADKKAAEAAAKSEVREVEEKAKDFEDTGSVWYMLGGLLRTSRSSQAASRRDRPSFMALVARSMNCWTLHRPVQRHSRMSYRRWTRIIASGQTL